MKYIGIKEASKKWGISDRRIRILCQEGRIEGALKLEWSWAIPENASKPHDGRVLRHFKNNIRLGSIDIERISEFQHSTDLNKIDFKSDFFKKYTNDLFSLSSCLDSKELKDSEIESITKGNLSKRLSLDDHTLILNFASIFSRMFSSKEEVSSMYLEELDYMLTLGMIDSKWGFRDGFSETSLYGKDNLKITLQIESLFNQYDAEWKNLHPIFRSSILFSEIIRMKPFDSYNYIIALLVLSKVLISNNILPPKLDKTNIDELNATLSLSMRRGNFQDLARLIERKVIEAFLNIKKTWIVFEKMIQ